MLFMFWKRNFWITMICLLVGTMAAGADQSAEKVLEEKLGRCYTLWRNAMVSGDHRAWELLTSKHRQVAIKNRINSEQGKFPQDLFVLPAAPPSLSGLKALRVRIKGATATAVYYGKVDVGLKGKPENNLLLLHFTYERRAWKYDRADFLSLAALPEVRKKLVAGDYRYVDQADFLPSGVIPRVPAAIGPAQYIAKVYVFCPGRAVNVNVNRRSRHSFIDTKAAEVVIGGGKAGLNELEFTIKSLEGSTGKEALCVRVYLMSTVRGVQPVKIYEYLVKEGELAKASGKATFTIDKKTHKMLQGGKR